MSGFAKHHSGRFHFYRPRWNSSMRFRFLTLAVTCGALTAYSPTVLTGGLVPPGTGSAPSVYALVIGIDSYKHSSLSLKYAEQDARRFFDALTDAKAGIATPDTTVLLLGAHATKQAILDAAADLKARALSHSTPKEDESLTLTFKARSFSPNVLVYFAGHSTYRAEANELHLAPWDVEAGSDSHTSALNFADELVPTLADPAIHVTFIGDGCSIGDGLSETLTHNYPKVTVLSASKENEQALDLDGGLFTKHLVQALLTRETDLNGDAYISVEEAYNHLYAGVVKQSVQAGMTQHPSVSGKYRHVALLSKAPADELILTIDDDEDAIQTLSSNSRLSINGTPVSVTARLIAPGRIQLLGDFSGRVSRGLNYLEGLKKQFVFWQEENKLVHCRQPYHSSYAVLVAIDDYERKRDPLRRGPTGYAHRERMVSRAEELKGVLKRLGFPETNIITLYNDRATSPNIDRALSSFWRGGQRSSADRLFFYFGGHGDAVKRGTPRSGAQPGPNDESIPLTGFLVTYDFDVAQPTLTSFLMKDLTGRHAENVLAHHMLVALDACHSGLAVYNKLGDPVIDKDLEEFKALSVLRNDTASPARNILVAGKENQGALWDDGGVFTQGLIRGLSGSADFNQDGLIQFSEISTFVKNEVANQASTRGVRQQAMDYRLDALGSGSVVFFAPEAPSRNTR